MSFSEEVTTPSGNKKTIVADTKEDLRAGVKAAKDEPVMVTPDIDNPDHGNFTAAEFAKAQGQDVPDTEFTKDANDFSREEANVTSDTAKDNAKDASREAGMLEKEAPLDESSDSKTSKKSN